MSLLLAGDYLVDLFLIENRPGLTLGVKNPGQFRNSKSYSIRSNPRLPRSDAEYLLRGSSASVRVKSALWLRVYER